VGSNLYFNYRWSPAVHVGIGAGQQHFPPLCPGAEHDWNDGGRGSYASQGIYDVTVRQVRGHLTDHYDPRTKTVNLSQAVYSQTSVAALGVAAHECGHAIQDNVGYAPLRLRSAFVPVANLGSTLSWPLIVIGLLIGMTPFIRLGIWMFTLALLFQVITLPVEFNASSRAVTLLDQLGILSGQEVDGTRKVLGAAALTYVAAVAVSLLQLLRLVLLFGGRRDDD